MQGAKHNQPGIPTCFVLRHMSGKSMEYVALYSDHSYTNSLRPKASQQLGQRTYTLTERKNTES